MRTPIRARTVAAIVGRVLLIFIGWCVLMVTYLFIYAALEKDAVPVLISPFKDVQVFGWDSGFVKAEGSFKNQSAENDDDELIMATSDITCDKSKNECTIATASEYSGFMNLDVSTYRIDSWDDKTIRMSDDSSICAEWSYAIDRATQTMNGTRRLKAVIPEYAKKSKLRPCEGQKDLNVSLVKGDIVHEQKIKSFENRNSLRLHLFLAALNVIYFGLIGLSLWRRRQRNAANA